METKLCLPGCHWLLLKHCVIYFSPAWSSSLSPVLAPFWPLDLLASLQNMTDASPVIVFLRCLFLSPRKFLSSDLLTAFSCLLKYHPQDTFLSPKKTSSASFYSLNLLDFPSKHISLLETMFFVCLFHWNINSECGDLAFLLPVEFSVLNSSACDIKRCSINIC